MDKDWTPTTILTESPYSSHTLLFKKTFDIPGQILYRQQSSVYGPGACNQIIELLRLRLSVRHCARRKSEAV